MSNGENGKTAKNGEIDRLLKLIDSVARIDTKIAILVEQQKTDVDRIKSLTDELERRTGELEKYGAQTIRDQIKDIKDDLGICSQDIMDAERRRNEVIKQIADLQKEFDRWKIYFGLIAFIGSPAITTFIIWIVTKILGNVF